MSTVFLLAQAMRRLIIACLALLALTWPAANPAQPPRFPRAVRVAPFETVEYCLFDRIMIGPAGTEVALWQDDQRETLGSRFVPPATVIVGSLSDLPSTDRLFAYSGETIFPLRWSSDGSILYARTRGPPAERVVALYANGGAARTLAPLSPEWRRVDIAAIAHGDAEPLTNPAILVRIARMEAERLIRGHATLGREGIELLGTRTADLQLVRIGETSSTPLGINASQTRNLIAIHEESSAREGVFHLGAPVPGATSYLPYQRVLIDLETGQLAGTYGISALLPWRAEAFAATVATFNGSPDRAKEIILDVSRSGDVIAVLLVDAAGIRRIALINSRGISMRTLCGPNRFVRPPSRPATEHRVRSFALGAQGREENAPGRPIVMLHQMGAAAADAVVYFHGGPGGTMADGFFTASAVSRVITRDRDVIAVEYSGSQGGGMDLTRRLADRGLPAIEEDVDALVHWLDRQNYRRVFVIGTSFGGVPALAAARHRRRFDAIFFVAPLLRLREPGDWVRSLPIPAAPDTHLAFELAYLGGVEGRRRFGDDLAALLAAVQLQASDRFYFGDRDRVSRPEDLPPVSAASQLTLPGTHHMAMLSSRVMWDDILARMR